MANLHEKHQRILAEMLREEANRVCADCGSRGPRWASWNLGVFVCIRCAGIHRNLGVHISRVKSVNLDSWTPEQIETIQQGGNDKAMALYEANLPSDYKRPMDDYAVEQFIRQKYVRKAWAVKGAETAGGHSKPKAEKKEKGTKETKSSPSTSKKSELKALPRPHTLSPGAPPSRSSSAPAIRHTPEVEAPPLLDLHAGDTPSAAHLPPTSLTASAPNSNPSLLDDPGPPPPMDTPSLFPPASATHHRTASQPMDRAAILSLYNANPANGGAPPTMGYHHGYPYHQQQQQMAVLHAQQQVYYSQMQNQVAKVQEQMARLKMRQQQQQQQSTAHGDTLNPHLW